MSGVGAGYSRSFGAGGSGARPYAPVNRVYDLENTQIYTVCAEPEFWDGR